MGGVLASAIRMAIGNGYGVRFLETSACAI